MPLSAQATDRVAERWKTCAMWTRSDPDSRASSTFGTQAIVNSGPSAAEPTCCGTIVTAAGEDLHRQVFVFVVALLIGGVVAGELGLVRPLQLESDRCRRCAWLTDADDADGLAPVSPQAASSRLALTASTPKTRVTLISTPRSGGPGGSPP